MTMHDEIEKKELFRQKNDNSTLAMFTATGSAGNNPVRLAQILSALAVVIDLLGWNDKQLANLPKHLVTYQASLDGKYHNDFKDVLVAEEIERKRAERKGISILSQ